jgi:glucosamine--fructose-6-phosphate aminotransferase (isomerizing)
MKNKQGNIQQRIFVRRFKNMSVVHNMYKEILEEPQTVARTIEDEFNNASKIVKLIQARQINHVIITARGTSDNAGQFSKYLFEIINGVPVSMAAPSVFTLYGQTFTSLQNTLVIGISQSGEGLDVNQVIKKARESGALTVGLTNNKNSSLADTAEYSIFGSSGVENSVAATKTYAAQVTILLLISLLWADRIDLLQEFRKIPEHMISVLAMEGEIKQIVNRYRYMKECVVLGRGFNFATALETALKIKETCYVGSQPYSSADFLHGPIAIIDEGFPVFVVAPDGKTLPGMIDIVKELRERKAEIIVLSPNIELLKLATIPIKLSVELNEVFSPLLYILPMQLFCYHLALLKGINPDQPRGLRKVTITL